MSWGLADTAAEQQQLGLRRRQGDGQFIVQTSIQVAQHLVFVHHQQRRTVALEEPVLLRLQGGNHDGSLKVFRQVARGDAHIPSASPPFGQFVIGQRSGRHGVDCLSAILALVGPHLEDQGLAEPVGAWTTTSLPSRKAVTACCCHRSGTVTWFSTGKSRRG